MVVRSNRRNVLRPWEHEIVVAKAQIDEGSFRNGRRLLRHWTTEVDLPPRDTAHFPRMEVIRLVLTNMKRPNCSQPEFRMHVSRSTEAPSLQRSLFNFEGRCHTWSALKGPFAKVSASRLPNIDSRCK